MTSSISYKLLNLKRLIVFIKHVFIFKLQQCIFIEVSLAKIIFLFPLHLFILNFNTYLAIHLFTLFYSSYALYFQSFSKKYIAKFYFWYFFFMAFLWRTFFFPFSFFAIFCFIFFLANETSLMNSNAKQKFLNKVYLGSFITYIFSADTAFLFTSCFKEIWVQKIKYLLNKNVNAA